VGVNQKVQIKNDIPLRKKGYVNGNKTSQQALKVKMKGHI
jgi:hypothetical protein